MSLLRRLRYSARNKLGTYPAAVGVLRWRRGAGGNPLRPDTQLCLEGFPRSGNTYASILMRERGVERIASHSHAPGQIRRALRRGVPTVLLVRDPVEAVASQLVGAPWLRPADVLRAYSDFHAALWPVRDELTVLSFETLTGDAPAAIRVVADATGLPLDDAAVSEEERTRIFHHIKWLSEIDPRQDERMAARPSTPREDAKQAVRHEIQESPRLPEALGWFDRWSDLGP